MPGRGFAIYVHIPFCREKCRYCDFLSFSGSLEAADDYLAAMRNEMALKARLYGRREVKSVFVGGGTPSLLSPKQIHGLMDALRRHFSIAPDAEISMESNPDSLDAEKIGAMLETGVNRLSIGVQSFADNELRRLGRIHSAKQAESAAALAARLGFDNINLDLMFGIPEQNPESWERTLGSAIDLNPAHLSCYSLSLEDGTPLALECGLQLPDEDTERAMYHGAIELLGRAEYRHYEISNFARPGFECGHNLVYWTMADYLALGLGASSFMDGRRYKNTDVFADYLSGGFSEKEAEVLTREDEISEFMFLSLRLTKGVSAGDFQNRFGVAMDSLYGNKIKALAEQGLVVCDNKSLRLSAKGLDLANVVFAEMLL